jgi:prepilin-type N-terminal cleavage/methylation domain-containing protein
MEERRKLNFKNTLSTNVTRGFTMIEALLASALLAIGLAASVRLSMASMQATQSSQNLDTASAMAQDLSECWGVQTPLCVQQFESTSAVAELPNGVAARFSRTWTETDIAVQGAPLGSLKELRIKVTWIQDDQTAQSVWVKRRAQTPSWVGS